MHLEFARPHQLTLAIPLHSDQYLSTLVCSDSYWQRYWPHSGQLQDVNKLNLVFFFSSDFEETGKIKCVDLRYLVELYQMHSDQ